MEKGQKQNGGENNPNKTKEDHTHDTSDLENNESDKKGDVPAEHANVDGTEVVSNEVEKPSDEAQDATDLSDKTDNTDSSDFEVLTGDKFSSGEEPKTEIQVNNHDNEASQREEGEQVCGADANTSDTTEGSQTIQPDSSGGPGTTPDMPEETSRTMSSANGGTTQPTTDSSGEALKLKANGKEVTKPNVKAQDATDLSNNMKQPRGNKKENTNTSEFAEITGDGSSLEVPKQSDEAQDITNLSDKTENTDASDFEELTGDGFSSEVPKQSDEAQDVTDLSDKTENTDASDFEELTGDGFSSVNEAMKEPPATEDDNGASQPEGGEEFQIAVDITSGKTGVSLKIVKPKNPGDNRALPSENKQSELKNLQSESGSSAPEGKCEKDREAQKRAAKGRSKEEKDMKTGTGANKDNAKEYRPKEKKANGEGVKGEGGTEDAVKTEERVVKERPVSISLCTSAYSFNVEGLVSYLKGLMKQHPQLIKEVKFHELPCNELDHYRFDEKDPVDVMILCHSINNRRFAITDVTDALYDEYLPYCARVVGKEKMGVIVHDFGDMRETERSSRMSSFRYKQPKAFAKTSLQITCGHIEKEEQVLEQMLKEDRIKLFEFLKNASKHPEKFIKQRDIETTRQKVKRMANQAGDLLSSFFSWGTGSNEAQRSSTQQRQGIPQHKHPPSDEDTGEPKPEEKIHDAYDLSRSDPTGDMAQIRPQSYVDLSCRSQMSSASGSTSVPQRSLSQPTPLTEPRSTSVSICSSAYQHNVKGLVSWLTNFKTEHPHMINDVRFRSLPYNDIDSFRFPKNDPVDVMVLCHSVDNRGFSITNVLNALYEKYLKYCHDLIGKKKLAVIVHDFADWKPATVEGRMESFRRMQPLTFELVETVIICGRLEDQAKLNIREDDLTRLIHFLELASFEPKQNLKQLMLGKLF